MHLRRDNDNKIIVSGVPILSKQSFLYTGRRIHFIWEDAGINLLFPDTVYEGEIEISVAIFGTSGEHYVWPPGYRFMPPASATYQITASAPLPAPVTVRMEHCAVVEKDDSLVYMVAHGGPPFRFQPLYGGKFPLNESYGEIEVTEFSLLTIAYNIYYIVSQTSTLAIHVVYFSDHTALFVVTKNLPAHCAAVEQAYKSATHIDPWTMTYFFNTTEITFSQPEISPQEEEGWNIKMSPKPADINMMIVHDYTPKSVAPSIRVKLEWKGEGQAQELKEDVQIRVQAESEKVILLSWKKSKASPQSSLLKTKDPCSGMLTHTMPW